MDKISLSPYSNIQQQGLVELWCIHANLLRTVTIIFHSQNQMKFVLYNY
jgi:hypothetical protein